MRAITEAALITCDHATGVVAHRSSQSFVRITGRLILVGQNPANKGISGCMNMGPTIRPCKSTLAVEQGRSSFVYIRGKPVCLDTVVGGTDGTPPSATKYRVRSSGQTLAYLSG